MSWGYAGWIETYQDRSSIPLVVSTVITVPRWHVGAGREVADEGCREGSGDTTGIDVRAVSRLECPAIDRYL